MERKYFRAMQMGGRFRGSGQWGVFLTPARPSAGSPLPVSLYTTVGGSAVLLQWVVVPSEHTDSSRKVCTPEQSVLPKGENTFCTISPCAPTPNPYPYPDKRIRRLKTAWKWTSALSAPLPSVASSNTGFRIPSMASSSFLHQMLQMI